MKSFLELTNFLLDLYNLGRMMAHSSSLNLSFGEKNLSQPMNFHFLIVLGMLSSCSDHDLEGSWLPRRRETYNFYAPLQPSTWRVNSYEPIWWDKWPSSRPWLPSWNPFHPSGKSELDSRSRVPMTNRGSSSSLHVEVSHSVQDWEGMRVA